MTTDLRIIRRQEIENRFGMGRSLLYKEIARGNFPPAIKLSSSPSKSGAAGWIESEVVQYFEDRIAESRAGLCAYDPADVQAPIVATALLKNAPIVLDRS